MEEQLNEIISYYKTQSVDKDQGSLKDFLRELKDYFQGPIPDSFLSTACEELHIKPSFLNAVMKYIPDIKTESVSHHLVICGGKNCQANDSAALRNYIESTYKVKNGSSSKEGHFSYKIGGCMKNCKNGPCVQWDGNIYTKMTISKLNDLIK